MSTAAPSIDLAPAATAPSVPRDLTDAQLQAKLQTAKEPPPTFLHSPPDSNNTAKSDASDSELSELGEEPSSDIPFEPLLPKQGEQDASSAPNDSNIAPEQGDEPADAEEDIGEVLPADWSGAVPIFRPTMHQFKDFKRFMTKVNSYGMKSGIIKIIPPKEWKDNQPPLNDLIKTVRVREPIKQDIMGSNGTYRQVNILHGRSYNVPQWRQLCEQSEHQPPAKRGERRANADKPKAPKRPAAPKAQGSSAPKKRGRKPGRGRGNAGKKQDEERPMTPVSPQPDTEDHKDEDVVVSVEQENASNAEPSEPKKKSKTQSVSARRKYSKREGSAAIDEAAFKDFDYKMDITDYTPERCEELERAYWKTLTYAAPLYGADMMGSLFDDRTEMWNLNKLPNLLDVLGTKIPGVNTAYLYFGMWKATFAWHLEDVDLYSINYVHFGAPKQWYSISQADARRFEAAMKNIWPAEAKACNQFLRHKGFLISPQHLLQQYGIKVNKVVSYPGEFVVTYPYGYHSGYNLGYNCAEAVNFALEPWLEMGKIAKRCECAQAQDSVWINVYEIERKLRGEETEYEDTEDEDNEEGDDEDGMAGLPTPPAAGAVKTIRKRKRDPAEKGGKPRIKRIKLRLKSKAEPPCCLCPNDIGTMEIMPTDDGRKVHRICALYLPETYIDDVEGKEVVVNVSGIHKDRTELKCLYCRSKRGACFQCSQKKCARAYHATCAAAAGVFVEEGEVPVFGEDETEYKEQAFEFSCRFHRSKRDKKLDASALEDDARIRKNAEALEPGAICQSQYLKGDIFAGVLVENRREEETLLIDILPHGDRVEVDWKWLLLPDPSDYHLPKASAKAIPLSASRKAKEHINAKRGADEKPRKDDPFVEGCTWAEFNLHELERNQAQVKVDLAKPDQIWYYLSKGSTDTKAKYTEDPTKPVHNPRGNFLDTLPKPLKPVSQSVPKQPTYRPYASPYTAQQFVPQSTSQLQAKSLSVKPYVYKPRDPVQPTYQGSHVFTTQRFAPAVTHPQTAAPNMSSTQPPHASNGALNMSTVAYYQHQFNSTPSRPQPTQTPQPVNGLQHVATQAHQSRPVHYPAPVQAPGTQGRPQQKMPVNSIANVPQPPGQLSHQSKPNWQVHTSVYNKYPFFQVHHNRDSSKYRTPYSPWGGFTNGYEGDLRAHLLQNQNELLRKSNLSSSASLRRVSSGASNAELLQLLKNSSSVPATNPAVSSVDTKTPQIPAQQASPIPQPSGQASVQTTPTPAPTKKPKPAPAPKSYKVPAKQSPVPLPANFLAAMTSSFQSSPSSLSKALGWSNSATKTPSSADTPSNSGAAPATGDHGGVNMAPIPKFVGMTPHQAAAKARPSDVQNGTSSMMPSTVTARDHVDSMEVLDHQTSPKLLDKPDTEIQNLLGAAPTLVRPEGTVPTTAPTGAQTRVAGPAGDDVQDFPDVPGKESMEFMEKMMANLRRVVRLDE